MMYRDGDLKLTPGFHTKGPDPVCRALTSPLDSVLADLTKKENVII